MESCFFPGEKREQLQIESALSPLGYLDKGAGAIHPRKFRSVGAKSMKIICTLTNMKHCISE